jgi:hypothetical protein
MDDGKKNWNRVQIVVDQARCSRLPMHVSQIKHSLIRNA